MRQEFCKVELDLSYGSSYEYKKDSNIPTIIKFGRYFNGKFEKGNIEATLNNSELHNVVYLIKRGYDLKTIIEEL